MFESGEMMRSFFAFFFFVWSVAFAQSSSKELLPSLKNYSFEYNDEQRTLHFLDREGRNLGKYESNFRLPLYTEPGSVKVEKIEKTEVLITQWMNGAATFNIRVFAPLQQGKSIPAQSLPICEVEAQGDPLDLRGSSPLLKVIRRQNKKILQIRNEKKTYQDCLLLKN